MLATAAALALWPRPGPEPEAVQDVATPVAARRSITLAEGSVLEFNARTTASIALNATERRVRLAGGEAYFRVTRDPARPFYVETPAGTVRVTGTEFNVSSDSTTRLEVTVVTGSVQVRPAADPVPRVLGAGDQLVAADREVRTTGLSARELDAVLAWRQGQVVFNGTPLRDALARFALHHGRTITVAESVALARVGSRFSLDDLDGFLTSIEESLGVRVRRDADGTIHVAPVTQPGLPADSGL